MNEMTGEQVQQIRDVAEDVLSDYDSSTVPGLLARAVLDLTRQQALTIPREELIELGARAIQPAFGPASVKKATLVVDAILARYAVTAR